MNFKEKCLKLKNSILEAIFPSNFSCILCDNEMPDDSLICEECRKEQIFNVGNKCCKCDTIVKEGNIICDNCKENKRFFEKCFCPLIYDGNVRKAILKFKSDRAKYFAKPFAKLIYERILQENIDIDFIVPVPSHIKTIKKRGYNPAFVIAEELSLLMNKPVCDILEKNILSSSQKTLTFVERQTNLENCMVLKDKTIVKNKNILIVDDVITTCATINACASLLHRANKIYAVAVARTQLTK